MTDAAQLLAIIVSHGPPSCLHIGLIAGDDPALRRFRFFQLICVVRRQSRFQHDGMASREPGTGDGLSRHLTMRITLAEKMAIRDHAIRRGMTVTQLLRVWIDPQLHVLAD